MHRHHDPNESHHHHHAPAGDGWSWRRVALGLFAISLVGYLATGIFSVQPNEVAAVRRCGELLKPLRGPGLHFGLPYGIDRVDKIKLMQLKRVGVGLGLADRTVGRPLQPQLAEGFTGDRNLVVISAVVQYRISSAKDYLLTTVDVPALIENTAGSVLTTVIASMPIDDLITTQRIEVQTKVKAGAQELLDQHAAGIEIISVSLEGTAPPQEVAAAFADVTSAREDKEKAKNQALGYANRLAAEAKGEAARIGFEAQGYASEVKRRAEGDAARFTLMANELKGRRQLALKRLTLEALEEILPRLKKIMIDAETGGGLDLGIFAGEPQETSP